MGYWQPQVVQFYIDSLKKGVFYSENAINIAPAATGIAFDVNLLGVDPRPMVVDRLEFLTRAAVDSHEFAPYFRIAAAVEFSNLKTYAMWNAYGFDSKTPGVYKLMSCAEDGDCRFVVEFQRGLKVEVGDVCQAGWTNFGANGVNSSTVEVNGESKVI